MRSNLLLSIFLLVLVGCRDDTSQQLDGFSKYLEDIGYSFYNPPRTDRGPASVFRFVKSESGKTIVSPVCKKLFLHVPENEASLSLPSEKSKDKLNIGLAISLIEDLLSDTPKLEAGWSSGSSIEVKFNGVKSVNISEEDLYNKNGVARSITPSCFSALKRISKQGEFKQNVFIVQESIRVDSMQYDATKTNVGTVNAQANIKKLIKFKPGINYEFKGDSKLEIKEQRYIAFRAFLLKDFFDTGLTTTGSAVVKAEPLSLSEINKRVNKNN